MKPKEVLDRFVNKDLTAKWPDPVLKSVISAMKEYARQQVNAAPKKNVKHSYDVTLRTDDAMRIANLDTDMMAVKAERI